MDIPKLFAYQGFSTNPYSLDLVKGLLPITNIIVLYEYREVILGIIRFILNCKSCTDFDLTHILSLPHLYVVGLIKQILKTLLTCV